MRLQVAMFLAVSLLPFAALAAYGVYEEARHARNLSQQSALQIARVTANSLSQFLADSERSLTRIARDPDILSFESDRCLAFLTHARTALAQFVNLWVSDTGGRLTCTATPTAADNPSPTVTDRPYFQAIMGGATFVVGAPQLGRITGKTVSVVVVPILSASGDVRGLVGAAIDLQRFQELLRSPGGEPGSVVTLANGEGTIVARSVAPEVWVGKTVFQEKDGGTDFKVSELQVGDGIDGVRREGVWEAVEGSDWFVYAGVGTEQLTSDIVRRSAGRVGIGAGILVLFIILTVRGYHGIRESLGRLRESAQNAALGRPITIDDADPVEVREVATAFAQTIREREAALEQLRHSTQRQQSVFNNALFGMYVATEAGRILDANPAFANMLGFSSVEELVSHPMTDFYEDGRERSRLLEEARKTPQTIMETRWKRTDGVHVPVRVHISRVHLTDGEVVHEVIVEDLSEKAALEEQFRQAQKLEAVGRLAGGIAHDFNNRLTVIQGETDLLLDELPQTSDFRSPLLAISDSAEMAARLTAQLLAFSRRQIVSVRAIDLNSLLSDFGDVLQKLIGEDIVLTMVYGEDIGLIQHDRGQVQQMLMNLSTNARDAMPDGGTLTISTSVEFFDPELGGTQTPPVCGPYVVLSCTDNGEGMSEDTRLHALEPFYTTKEVGRGSGLGLSSVHSIISGGGGDIRLISSLGAGTTVELWFPQCATGSSEPVVAGPAAESPRGAGSILVVEDEQAVRELVARSLTRAGFQVEVAHSGLEALEMCSNAHDLFDAVVTDVVMPGMRGTDLAERLAHQFPDLPVLFMSGYAETEMDVGESGRLRRDFIAKPFKTAELVEVLNALLRS
jgi:PAS domain S-box-containing protein